MHTHAHTHTHMHTHTHTHTHRVQHELPYKELIPESFIAGQVEIGHILSKFPQGYGNGLYGLGLECGRPVGLLPSLLPKHKEGHLALHGPKIVADSVAIHARVLLLHTHNGQLSPLVQLYGVVCHHHGPVVIPCYRGFWVPRDLGMEHDLFPNLSNLVLRVVFNEWL